MKKKKLRKIIFAAIPAMRDHLGLNTWILSVRFGKLKGGSSGSAECKPSPDHRYAILRFNPEKVRSKELALDALRHEMLHVVLSSGQDFRKVALAACDDLGEPVIRVLEEAWFQAEEKNLVAVERALQYMGRTPEWLAKKHDA